MRATSSSYSDLDPTEGPDAKTFFRSKIAVACLLVSLSVASIPIWFFRVHGLLLLVSVNWNLYVSYDKRFFPALAFGILAASVLLLAVVAWYQSLPRPGGGPIGPTAHWTEYVLTKNGNHTQVQASYSNGQVSTEQILWLNSDNRTAVYNYFGCTPSMPGCTLDGCALTVLNDTASEYWVKVYCEPGG